MAADVSSRSRINTAGGVRIAKANPLHGPYFAEMLFRISNVTMTHHLFRSLTELHYEVQLLCQELSARGTASSSVCL